MGCQTRERLVSICNCCECCCIFRAYPKMYGPIDNTLKKLEGVSVRIGEDCVGCGACEKACFVNAIRINDGMAEISEACRGCGRCVNVCPNHAVSLEISGHGVPDRPLERLA